LEPAVCQFEVLFLMGAWSLVGGAAGAGAVGLHGILWNVLKFQHIPQYFKRACARLKGKV